MSPYEMIQRPSLALLSILAFLLPLMASAMIFAKPLVLFSAIDGRVTRAGQPVAGARIERSYLWHWKDRRSKDEALTDSLGRFHFDPVTDSSFTARLVPHEPLVQQTLVIRLDGQEYLAWKYSKHNYADGGRGPGRALHLACELDNPESYHLVDERAKLGYQGICHLQHD